MITCPNKASDEWKILVNKVGEKLAYYYWNEYGGEVPNTVPTFTIKPGVPELFEENPELANAVYEALGFNYTFDNIDNVFVLNEQVAFNKLERNQEGDFNITSKVLQVREKNLESNLRHELVHEFINQLPNEEKDSLYKNAVILLDKIKQDSYFDIYKGSLSHLQQLEKLYIKDKTPIFFAEEFINIGLGNRAHYKFLTDLINEKYKNEFLILTKDIDLNRIENKVKAVIKRNKIETEPQPYGHKYKFDITPQQKQQAQQLYSQYLDTIFPDYINNFAYEAVEEFLVVNKIIDRKC